MPDLRVIDGGREEAYPPEDAPMYGTDGDGPWEYDERLGAWVPER